MNWSRAPFSSWRYRLWLRVRSRQYIVNECETAMARAIRAENEQRSMQTLVVCLREEIRIWQQEFDRMNARAITAEAEVKRLRDEIDRHLAENHSQDVIEDHDAPIYKYVWERQDDPAPQIDEDWITYGTSRWTSRWTRGG